MEITKHDLNQLYYLKREIQHDSERLRELRETLDGLKAQQLTGMPSGGPEADKMASQIARIEELEQKIQAKRDRLWDERCKDEEFISSQTDSLIRQLLTYRFIDCYSWARISAAIGDKLSPEAARKTLERFFADNH